MSEKLLPCCHCGTEKEGTEPIIIGGAYRVVCQECQSSTGLYNTPEEAVAAWNKRFVCLDSNGKKVFAGDQVKAGREEYGYTTGEIVFDDEELAWCIDEDNNSDERQTICRIWCLKEITLID